MGLSNWTQEVEAEHLAACGPDLGPVYSALSSDVLSLHGKWLEYRELYAGSEARIDLLNEMAPHFFWILQNVLWRDVLLHISRLTDPPKLGRFKNLTLLSLPPLLDEPVRAQVKRTLETAVEKSAFARDYRNRHLAHQDNDHALDRVAPLSMGSRRDVEDALRLFVDVLNEVASHYLKSTMLYREVRPLGDADSLVYWLNYAQVAEAKRRARMRDGTFTQEDLQHWSPP